MKINEMRFQVAVSALQGVFWKRSSALWVK